MTFNNFKKLYDEIRPENINVSGLGEPFLNPEIFTIIRHAKKSGSAVNCASNFTLVSEHLEEILDCGIDQIKISIDAADSETFYQIRRQDLYATLVNNIKRINQLKAAKGIQKPTLRFNYALQHDNIDQLIDTIKLAHQLKVSSIYVQYLEYIDREHRKQKLVGSITRAKLLNTLVQANGIANKLNITTNIRIWLKDFDLFYNKMQPRSYFKPNKKKCYFPWFTAWIDADGSVRPCPIIPWQRNIAVMGNVFKEQFSDIWNNSRYKRFRHALARGERPTEPCKTCIPLGLLNILHVRNRMLPWR